MARWNRVLRVLLLGVLTVATRPCVAADWPQWRGPARNGVSEESGWLTTWPEDGPKVLWRESVGTGFSSIAISAGRVYTMGNTGPEPDSDEANQKDVVYCLDAETGKKIWSESYKSELQPKLYEGGPGATPTVDGDRVYTQGKHTDLYCFEAATGKVVWSHNLKQKFNVRTVSWGYAGSPLVVGDRVFVNAATVILALNKTNGKLVWRAPTGQSKAAAYASMVLYDHKGKQGLATFQASAVLAVDAASGKKLWQYPWETKYDLNIADPIVSGDKVFISSGYNHGSALLDISGPEPKEVWTNRKMRNHFNSCVLWKGHFYGFDEAKLKCVDFATGDEKWSQSRIAKGKGSLIIADGKLLALGDGGTLVVAEAASDAYKELARAKILDGKCWTAPALANGRIYARNATGDLVCLDVRKP